MEQRNWFDIDKSINTLAWFTYRNCILKLQLTKYKPRSGWPMKNIFTYIQFSVLCFKGETELKTEEFFVVVTDTDNEQLQMYQ